MCKYSTYIIFLFFFSDIHVGHGNLKRVKLAELSGLLYSMDTDTLTVHISTKMKMKLVKHLQKFLKKEK